MSNTVNIASRSLFPLRLREPMPEKFADKPGLAPELRTVEIRGHHHNHEAITRGVDAEVWKLWLEANPHHEINRNGLLREVSDEEADDIEGAMPGEFGFEKGLERAAAAAEGNDFSAGTGHEEGDSAADLDMNAQGREPPGGTKDAAGDPGLAHANIAVTDTPIAGAETIAGSDFARRDDADERPVADPAPADATARDNPDRPRSDAGVV